MNKTRHAILQRLRQARPDAYSLPERKHYHRQFDWDLEERIRRFTERMQAVRAEVHRTDQDNWLAVLSQVCHDKQLQNLLASPHTYYGERLYAHTAQLPSLLAYEQSIENWQADLFWNTAASFTTTRGGIAETGTLIIWPDQEEPRLMSLVPPVHIAVLETASLYSTFAEAMREQQWLEQGMPTNALLISGPSKSADIEQTLAYGVHGPKELVVILI
ncbi:MAG: lactate utilization protein B/C [Proteobacteria bacterium]|nr:MAG: lactate utilization protein B/C [Pseudomonadota bacterium]